MSSLKMEIDCKGLPSRTQAAPRSKSVLARSSFDTVSCSSGELPHWVDGAAAAIGKTIIAAAAIASSSFIRSPYPLFSWFDPMGRLQLCCSCSEIFGYEPAIERWNHYHC